MGDVKDAVVGSGSKRRPPPRAVSGANEDDAEARPTNICGELTNLAFEISDLCTQKENDVIDEPTSEMTENARKAALLRAAFTLVNAAAALLEGYAAGSSGAGSSAGLDKGGA